MAGGKTVSNKDDDTDPLGCVTEDTPHNPDDVNEGCKDDEDNPPGCAPEKTNGLGEKDTPGCDTDKNQHDFNDEHHSPWRSDSEVGWLEDRLCWAVIIQVVNKGHQGQDRMVRYSQEWM